MLLEATKLSNNVLSDATPQVLKEATEPTNMLSEATDQNDSLLTTQPDETTETTSVLNVTENMLPEATNKSGMFTRQNI